jgi:hypothetical protein
MVRYDPDGNLNRVTGSCSHRDLDGGQDYFGCWYSECAYYSECPACQCPYWHVGQAPDEQGCLSCGQEKCFLDALYASRV